MGLFPKSRLSSKILCPFLGFSAGKSFTASQMEGKSNEEVEMMKLMGFTTFDTTKNKKVKSL